MTENSKERIQCIICGKTDGDHYLGCIKSEFGIGHDMSMKRKPESLDEQIEKEAWIEKQNAFIDKLTSQLADKEKDIETLKNRLENSYKSTDTTFMQMRDLANSNLKKYLRIKALEEVITEIINSLDFVNQENYVIAMRKAEELLKPNT